jgi:hypothetical protein
MNKEQIIKLMYKRLDDKLNPEEKKGFVRELLGSAALRKEYDMICRLRESVKGSAVNSFSPDFRKRLHEKINADKILQDNDNFLYDLRIQFRKIAFSAISIIAVMFIYNLYNGNNLTIESAFAVPEVTLESILNPVLYLDEVINNEN